MLSNVCVWSSAKVSKTCRSQQVLQKESLVRKIHFDAAENGLPKDTYIPLPLPIKVALRTYSSPGRILSAPCTTWFLLRCCCPRQRLLSQMATDQNVYKPHTRTEETSGRIQELLLGFPFQHKIYMQSMRRDPFSLSNPETHPHTRVE